MTIALAVFLFILLGLSYVFSDKEILAPSVLFSGSFFLSSIWAVAYQNKWDLVIHNNTFFVITGGVLLFSMIAVLIDVVYSKMSQVESDFRVKKIKLQRWKLLFIIFIELVTIAYTIHAVRTIEPAGSLSESISLYRVQSTSIYQSINLQSLPAGLASLRNLTDAVGYFFAYLLARNFVLYREINWLSLIIVFLSVISDLLLGSRTGSVMLVVCVLIYGYCIGKRKKGWKQGLGFRNIALIMILFVVIVATFQYVGSLLGRISDDSSGNYLAIYLGAEIKNLDTFLQAPLSDFHSTFGGQTFIYLNRGVARIFDIHKTYQFDLPFMSINGLSLGNVYTTFYQFVYDFGYIGVPILTGIMALISQYFFEKVKRFKDDGIVSIYLLIFGRISIDLILCFFSNKFYEDLFNPSFFKTVVIWIILNWFVCGTKKNDSELNSAVSVDRP